MPNVKMRWVARQVEGGWKLELQLSNKPHELKGLTFKTKEAVLKVLQRVGVTFIEFEYRK